MYLTTKSVTKNNVFIKKEGINSHAMGFFTKSRIKNVTFKLTFWIHNRANHKISH